MQDYNSLVKTMFWEILKEDFSNEFIQWMYDSVQHIKYDEQTYNEMYELLTTFFIDIATIVSEHPEKEEIISNYTFIEVVCIFSEEELSEWLVFDTLQMLNGPE